MNLNEKPTNDTGIVVNIQDDFAFVEVEKGEIFHLSENLSILIAILSVVLCFFILKFIDRIFSKKNIVNPKMISILR